jgi:hypothetical protein
MAEEEQYPDMFTNKNSQDISVDSFTTESALKIRLDCTDLKMQILNFLEGKQESIDRNKDGNLITRTQKIGKAMANPRGIQRIMSYIEHFVNPHAFQGNFEREQYNIIMERTRQEFSNILATNMYDYDINEDEMELITDNAMNLIETSSSRLIDNEERKSFVGTIMHSENSQANYAQKKNEGIWGKFKIGK